LGAGYPLTFLLAVRVLNGGTRAFGIMEAAIGLGYLIGSGVTGSLGERVRKGYAMTVGLTVMGLALVTVGMLDNLWSVLLPFLVLGAANAAALISIDTFFQQTVPEHLRGRVWGVRFALTQGFYALSILAGGGLATVYPVGSLFIVAGAIVAVPGIAGLFISRIRDI
jgi:MFS family permease